MNSKANRTRCIQCACLRRNGEKLSYRGLCDDCGALNAIASAMAVHEVIRCIKTTLYGEVYVQTFRDESRFTA